MKENNRKCITCGTAYSYCPTCGADVFKPSWYAIYHDANCRELFNIATDVLNNEITKEEARNRFDECSIPNKDILHHSIVDALDAIQYFDKTEKKEVTEDVKIEESDVSVNKEVKKTFSKRKNK